MSLKMIANKNILHIQTSLNVLDFQNTQIFHDMNFVLRIVIIDHFFLPREGMVTTIRTLPMIVTDIIRFQPVLRNTKPPRSNTVKVEFN